MPQAKTMLDYVFDHASAHPDKVYLTQPVGGGQVIDYTWAQVLDQARRMAAHLQSMGIKRGDRIAILSKNCAHFFIAELAIWMAGGATVAIFPTEGPDTIRYVLDHSEARLLFVGKLDTWERQAAGAPAGLPCIALPLAPAAACERWDAIVARTAPLGGRLHRQPDDLAMLIYTSGSTGQPKGVMHSFERITRAAAGVVQHIGGHAGDRYISYLPLAHVFERCYIECGSLIAGGHVFFAETLETFVADMQRARPTLFISVPRLWLKFQLGVFAKMPARRLDLLLRVPLLGKIVARKVLTGLGLDQVRLAGCGSAPIPAPLIDWYRRLGLNLLEGYAMTEDFCYSHISNPVQNAPGYVGAPFPGVEVRIGDGGEVLIKSPGQLIGYYKRPDLDAESFTEDGFFRTGDVGERRPDGLLKLTGRLKEIFKTANGKYVAPAPIENRLNAHPMVENSMVAGIGQPAPYALLMLVEDWQRQTGDPAQRAHIEAALARLLHDVNQTLPGYEQLRMLVVTREPWSIENGCLTPTMKIKRMRIEALMQDRLAAWYAAPGPVLWT